MSMRPGRRADRGRGGRRYAGPLLPREFFAVHSLEVAPRLLGCVLEHETDAGLVAVRLTEIEAYEGAADPASHSYRGRTARNGVMFGGPGYAYVYFTYGMHWCVNIVCLPPGTASAVLIRAGQVVSGVPLAVSRRSAGRAAAVFGRRAGAGSRAGPAVPGARHRPGPEWLSTCARRSPRCGSGPRRAGGSPAEISQGPRVGISQGGRLAVAVLGDRRPDRVGVPACAVGPRVRPAAPKAVSPSAGEGGTINR